MGKLKSKGSSEGGYVFIDVMIALVISGIAFVVLFGAISLSSRNAARIRERVDKYLQQKNNFVETREIDFVEE